MESEEAKEKKEEDEEAKEKKEEEKRQTKKCKRDGSRENRDGGVRRKTEQSDEVQGRGAERKRRRLESLTDAQSREEWSGPPTPFHLDSALAPTGCHPPLADREASRRALPALLAVMFKCPFLKWSQMVNVSQPAFDNQMLGSHKGVLRPGCWRELPFASQTTIHSPCLRPRDRPHHRLGHQEGS